MRNDSLKPPGRREKNPFVFSAISGAAPEKKSNEQLFIHDDYMHAVALKLLLQSGEYKTETRE